jgi:predicted amidohydrolase
MNATLGIYQFAPALGDVERNLATVETAVEAAHNAGVDLLVLPELALTGYTLKDMVPAVAQRLDSPLVRKLASLSERVSLVAGFVEESSDYRYYNAAAYFEGGRVVHVHRKVYLPTYGMFDEYRYMASGDRIRAFNTRFGRLAMLVCEDLWHPSTAYLTALDGASCLVGVACSPARGAQDDIQLYSSLAWQTLNRMYAHFFTAYVVFANRVGYEDGVGFWGGSEVVDPEGVVIARAPLFQEHFLTATLNADRVRRARIVSPFLRDERVDLTLRELERIHRAQTE